MKTAVVYATKHGFTKKCAELIASKLNNQMDLFNIRENQTIALEDYDNFILGSSIYIGKIDSELSKWITNHSEVLKSKKVLLYACGLHQGEDGVKQLEEIYPEVISKHATYIANIGYKVDFKKIGFMDKIILKVVAKITNDCEHINEQQLNQLMAHIR